MHAKPEGVSPLQQTNFRSKKSLIRATIASNVSTLKDAKKGETGRLDTTLQRGLSTELVGFLTFNDGASSSEQIAL